MQHQNKYVLPKLKSKATYSSASFFSKIQNCLNARLHTNKNLLLNLVERLRFLSIQLATAIFRSS